MSWLRNGACRMGSGEVMQPGDLIIVGSPERSNGETVYGIILECIERISHLPGTHSMCRALVKDKLVLLFENEITIVERANV